jgi:hypothetical protein
MPDDDPQVLPPGVVDGVAVADLIATLPLGRDSIYRLIRALGIETVPGPGDGGRGRIAWVRTADAERINDAAQAVAAKRATIGQYEAQAAGALVQAPQTLQTLQTVPEVESADSAATTDGAELLRRIDAAAAAAAIGFPLTTAETAWILGARPGAPVVTRGGLTATRTARNVWRLSADSAEG